MAKTHLVAYWALPATGRATSIGVGHKNSWGEFGRKYASQVPFGVNEFRFAVISLAWSIEDRLDGLTQGRWDCIGKDLNQGKDGPANP